MKKIKIIPFIISILFPLVCTTFIVCYSYGVNDTYTTNKTKYENYVLENYYDDNGQAKEEIKKAVQMDSHNFQVVSSLDGSYITSIIFIMIQFLWLMICSCPVGGLPTRRPIQCLI